ncbi:MAG: spermidine synthase [Polyangiales bacterium]
MPHPFTLLESVPTPEGLLELRQRGDRDFMISIGGQVLMTSVLRSSEIELAQRGCDRLVERAGARVLIGGLGLGFTLRAALDALPQDAQVVLAELNPVVVRWCRGPLAVLTNNSLADARVTVVERNVIKLLRDVAERPAEPRFDAIIWDLYRGPGSDRDDRLYGLTSLQRTHRSLSPGGVFAVWGEERDRVFEDRLTRCGFTIERTHSSGKGTKHALYIAVK